MKPVISQNRFLSRLPRALQEVFDMHSEITEVRKGQLGDFADDDEEFVFFPLTCLYSVDIRMTDGFQAHLALLGYRHALGTRYRSEPPLPGAARVIVSGYALRLPMDIFFAEWSKNVELQRSLHDQLFQMTRMLGIAAATGEMAAIGSRGLVRQHLRTDARRIGKPPWGSTRGGH
jgi:hypothetical protein